MGKHSIVSGSPDGFNQSRGRCLGWIENNAGTIRHQVNMR
jgi:hypothetical protein